MSIEVGSLVRLASPLSFAAPPPRQDRVTLPIGTEGTVREVMEETYYVEFDFHDTAFHRPDGSSVLTWTGVTVPVPQTNVEEVPDPAAR